MNTVASRKACRTDGSKSSKGKNTSCPRVTRAGSGGVFWDRRRLSMLLEGKNAVVYGGGGSVGGAVVN